MDPDLVYLDHAATTAPRRVALDEMRPWAESQFGNPSGSHRAARIARRAVDEARDRVADVIGVTSGEVVFTSCGTESDNFAIAGTVAAVGGTAVARRLNTTLFSTRLRIWAEWSYTSAVMGRSTSTLLPDLCRE